MLWHFVLQAPRMLTSSAVRSLECTYNLSWRAKKIGEATCAVPSRHRGDRTATATTLAGATPRSAECDADRKAHSNNSRDGILKWPEQQEAWTGVASVWLVDKPAGMTSHDVVRDVREALGLPRGHRRRVKLKVGHSGTLDPFATGLLVIQVGKATRLTPYLTGLSKRYTAGIALGVSSETLDIEGDIKPDPDTARHPTEIPNDEIARVLAWFLGTSAQTVPAYSAVKVGGKTLHKLARGGEALPSDLPVRDVTIHHIDRLDDGSVPGRVVIDVRVSKGTYIRALARDIGARLGCGALCDSLRRTEVGKFNVEGAVSAREVSRAGGVPLTSALSHLPTIHLTECQMRRLARTRDQWWEDDKISEAAIAGTTLSPEQEYAVVGPGNVLAGVFQVALCEGSPGRVKVNLLLPPEELPPAQSQD
eukprot:m.469941 g.469941  ORF g.469941 m.469941 type:complete len:421 (+) comp29252_c0_seq1:258-1520(+)